MSAITVTKENFNTEIMNYTGMVLLYFGVPWCAPCKTLSPVVDELASEWNGRLKVGKINMVDSPQLAVDFDVKVAPTLILIRDGEVVRKTVGAISKHRIEEMLN